MLASPTWTQRCLRLKRVLSTSSARALDNPPLQHPPPPHNEETTTHDASSVRPIIRRVTVIRKPASGTTATHDASNVGPLIRRVNGVLKPASGTTTTSGAANKHPRVKNVKHKTIPRPRHGHRAERETAISLLEELFPEEMRKSRAASAAAASEPVPVREIPLQPLEIDFTKPEVPYSQSEAGDPTHLPRTGRKWRYENSSVLVLSKAGKHLTEDDFKRALPAGKHLEGWTRGGPSMKVIRGRQLDNLQPNGDYFILFRNGGDAKAYMENARRLHKLAQTWSPAAEGLSGPIPPPPMPQDVLNTGETGFVSSTGASAARSTYADLASYTLLPASQPNIDIRQVQQPLSPLVRSILELGGYEPLLRDRKTPAEVLLRVDGFQPTLQAVRTAIRDDGRDRKLHWDVRTGGVGGGLGVREVQLPRRIVYVNEEDERVNESEARREARREARGDEGEDADATRRDAGMGTPATTHWWRLFIVSFWREDEAHRFVSAWHRRDIAPLLRHWETVAQLPPDELVIVNADMIW